MKVDKHEKLHFLVPGSLDNRTGGTIYDKRIIEGLEKLGIRPHVHEVLGNFPHPDNETIDGIRSMMERTPDNSKVIIDGLILGVIPEILRSERGRLKFVGLIHHPLCDETGLNDEEITTLLEKESNALGSVLALIVTSRFTAHRIKQLEMVQNDHLIHVVEPGVDAASLSPEHVPGKSFSFSSVGAVTKRKAHQDLLSAIAPLKDMDWTLTCIGKLDQDKEYADKTLKMTEDLDLSSRVHFTGELSEEKLEHILKNTDVLVHPSRYEGYGMVVMEAIARGIPVISSSGGALKYTVPKGSGILFEPGDEKHLKDVLFSILKDDLLYYKIRRGAVEAREGIRTWDLAAVEFKRALEGI